MMMIVTPIFITITIGVYLLSRIIARKYPLPFTTPVFFSASTIILLLLTTGIPYEQYEPAKKVITYLLGPATVALAVPFYKNRKLIMRYSLAAGAGLVLGTVATILSIVWIAKQFQLTDTIIASLSVKSATVPIAIEVANMIYGDLSLTAAFVVATGIIGGMIGPWFLDATKITDPLSRGLSMGAIAHGQGTAEIAREGQLQGAVAGMAMVLAAIFTSIFAPVLFSFLLSL